MPAARQFSDEHLHVLGATILDHHLPPGQAGSGQEGSRDQPVGDHPVGSRVKGVDPFNLDARRSRPLDACSHGVQEVGEIADLGLASGILDDGRALGQGGRHDHVVGAGVARILEDHAVADEARLAGHGGIDAARPRSHGPM